MIGFLSLLSLVAAVAFVAAVVLLVVRSVKRQPRKPFVILAVVSAVAFLGLCIWVSDIYVPAEKPQDVVAEAEPTSVPEPEKSTETETPSVPEQEASAESSDSSVENVDSSVDKSTNAPVEESANSVPEHSDAPAESSPAETEPEDGAVPMTALFDSIYVPLAQREKPTNLEAVIALAESLGYECNGVKADENTLGTVMVHGLDGDYIYLAYNVFMGMWGDSESAFTVTYHRESSNSEVSWSNISSDGLEEYDRLSTHVIGESEVEVSGVDVQRSFLFGDLK